MPKTWFVTGASRGLGAEVVRAPVRGGDQVIAAARNPTAVTDNLAHNSDRLLSVDVLVNNAGYGHYKVLRGVDDR
jgi:short-subunit dehydrogenase